MWRLSGRLFVAVSVGFLINFAVFSIVARLLGTGLVGALGYGVFFTVCLVLVEWLVGHSLVSSSLEPRWIERGDDPVLWSMVQEEAARTGVKVRKIGVVDSRAPNALTYSSLTGRPHIVFTNGLLVGMSYSEVRAVTSYLIGCAKSGGLPALTTLSGLLTIPHRIAGGYVLARLEGRRPSYGNFLSAAAGYILFVLIYPLSVFVSGPMSVLGDEFSILTTEDPSSFISALIKVSAGSTLRPGDPLRTRWTPLKCLMFQDPTLAIRDAARMREAADRWGIDLDRLVGLRSAGLPDEDRLGLHLFERFWAQPGLVQRLGHAIEYGKKVQAPIKVGLSWIE